MCLTRENSLGVNKNKSNVLIKSFKEWFSYKKEIFPIPAWPKDFLHLLEVTSVNSINLIWTQKVTQKTWYLNYFLMCIGTLLIQKHVEHCEFYLIRETFWENFKVYKCNTPCNLTPWLIRKEFTLFIINHYSFIRCLLGFLPCNNFRLI